MNFQKKVRSLGFTQRGPKSILRTRSHIKTVRAHKSEFKCKI